jgi:hypothetical protein
MFSMSRARVGTLAATGVAVVTLVISTVSSNASGAEIDSAASPDSRTLATAIPYAIRPPAHSRLIGAFLVVTGTQTYTCVVATGATAGVYSGPSVPEAQLIGTGGRIHHFAGPSWQSERDGSLVTATKVAQSASVGKLPDLLLRIVTHAGSGILDQADYVNRLYTSGGVAPTGSCLSGQTTGVTYRAVYAFWDAPAE